MDWEDALEEKRENGGFGQHTDDSGGFPDWIERDYGTFAEMWKEAGSWSRGEEPVPWVNLRLEMNQRSSSKTDFDPDTKTNIVPALYVASRLDSEAPEVTVYRVSKLQGVVPDSRYSQRAEEMEQAIELEQVGASTARGRYF